MVIAFSVFSRPKPRDDDDSGWWNSTLGLRDGLVGPENFKNDDTDHRPTGLAGGDVAFFVSVILKIMERYDELVEVLAKAKAAFQYARGLPPTAANLATQDLAETAFIVAEDNLKDFDNKIEEAQTVSDLVDITQFGKDNPVTKAAALALLQEFVPFTQDALDPIYATGIYDPNTGKPNILSQIVLLPDPNLTLSFDVTLDKMLDDYWPYVSGLRHSGRTYALGHKLVTDNANTFDALVETAFESGGQGVHAGGDAGGGGGGAVRFLPRITRKGCGNGARHKPRSTYWL